MDEEIVRRLDELVFEEHHLHQRYTTGDLLTSEERQRLQELEVRLDQCWELLRQRRAAVDNDYESNIVDVRQNIGSDF